MKFSSKIAIDHIEFSLRFYSLVIIEISERNGRSLIEYSIRKWKDKWIYQSVESVCLVELQNHIWVYWENHRLFEFYQLLPIESIWYY